ESLVFETETYIYEQIKRREQAVMDDDSLTTVEKITAILIAMPDSYSELDWRQRYQLEKSYPRIFARVRV
ncbi:TetR/AcrR family transcriptional regulator, partial [Coprococcus eutactus]|nr:TetR/AcrR family transcriptional regulator [Coprococcus eutactus]